MKLSFFYSLTLFSLFYSTALYSQKIAKAIEKGDTKEVAKIIKSNPKAVNSAIEEKGFPLLLAVSKQKVEIVKLLLKNGADINVADSKTKENAPFRLLDQPQTKGNLKKAMEIIKLLADKKTDFNVINSENISPLYKYCTGRHPYQSMDTKLEFLQVLIDAGAKTDLELKRDLPLLNAVLLKVLKTDYDPAAVAQLLIKNNVPINEKCKKDNECKSMTSFVEDDTPLLIVIKREGFQVMDKADMIILLIENGAKTTVRNKKKETPKKLIRRSSPYYNALYKTKVKKCSRR